MERNRKVREILHRLRVATINIDGIAHGLEGVETDAERKDHSEECAPLPAFSSRATARGIVAVDSKIEV